MSQPNRCQGCEVVSMPPQSAGTLYIAPAVPHTRKKITDAARALSMPCREEMAGIVGVELSDGHLDKLLAALLNRLSEPERAQSNALFLNQGEELTMAGLMQSGPLERLTSRAESRWLVELMEQDRLFAHFHPIVTMASPHEVHAHECLLRGQDEQGRVIPPFDIFSAARRADLLFHLDRAARLTAIRDAVRHGLSSRIFINFNPTAIYDPAFCLQTTVRATQDAGIAPDRLVFEVIESDQVEDSKHLLDIMNFYRRAGFGVALDDLGAGYASLNLLSSLRPDYVKFDRELIREIDANPYKQKVFSKLAEMARDLGVRTVAEGVETRPEWDYLADQGIDYVQGFLLCKPDAPPPTARIPE